MAHDPKLLQAILTEAVPSELDVAFRPMFGGIMAYADGKPFASLSDVGLGLKLAGSERDAMLALPGAAPLRYGPDQPPSKSYVLVPEAMLTDADQLNPWVIRCVSGLPAKRVRNRA
ncbi:TfoX/Sxy family protein [Sphingomonas nostoxanthinifaciens]|uniref:TfoX/Sxy family protein n=1 Tax=Sphingomonas nostoxanthinifaciens TaxID=2872652 RepID=UPI001CC1F2E4|nr:TfoX/Sxy family protein [Sphingomonas nostoxanthinifaciens]UAK25599.1 TfoX/Sxy family protein [Sphingomonas nostoxanthinifaciens]